MDRFKVVVFCVTVTDEVVVAALQNALWYKSSFHDGLIINEPLRWSMPCIEQLNLSESKKNELQWPKNCAAKSTNIERKTTGYLLWTASSLWHRTRWQRKEICYQLRRQHRDAIAVEQVSSKQRSQNFAIILRVPSPVQSSYIPMPTLARFPPVEIS